jgi:mycothiol synthase
VLDTDDFRLPAIKNYLNLRFVPMFDGENHKLRWQDIFEKLGLSKHEIASSAQKLS